MFVYPEIYARISQFLSHRMVQGGAEPAPNQDMALGSQTLSDAEFV